MKSGIVSLAGICGVLFAIVFFGQLFTMIGSSPSYSWTANWISDLGGTVGADSELPLFKRPVAETPTTISIYSAGAILSGILMLIFGFGLWKSILNPVGRIGAIAFMIASIAMISDGIFLAPSGLPHMIETIFLYLFAPIALFYIAAATIQSNQKSLGYLVTILGVMSMLQLMSLMWILELEFSMHFAAPIYFRNTVQMISMLAIAIFSIIFGVKIYNKAPNPIIS